MGESVGTVVFDERVFRISRIFLHNNAFNIIAEGRGPMYMSEGRHEYRLHGDDGTLVMISRTRTPELNLGEHDEVSFTIRCEVNGKEAGFHDGDERG